MPRRPPAAARRGPAAALAALAVLAAPALAGPAPPAVAAWSAGGTGPAAAGAAAVPAGTTPGVTGSGAPSERIFTLTWTTVQVGDRPVTGYVVHRTSTLLGAGLVSDGTCTGTGGTAEKPGVVPAAAGGTQSCTDRTTGSVGTVRYTVTPVYAAWSGAASAPSAPTA